MARKPDITVAVLLATHNGEKFIEPQIKSLKDNETPFTLHWLDDHSTDHTFEAVRAAATSSGISLREWHQTNHLGVPGAFFKLLECAEADIYLFCDQDDIWQPGKIDATVSDLLLDLESPALCFSDPLLFRDDEPIESHRLTEVLGLNAATAMQESRMFMYSPANGNTVGFTRALREIFVANKEIAYSHAAMHDCWMYILAQSFGRARMLENAPTTLYRQHGQNITTLGYEAITAGFRKLALTWRLQQLHRPRLARQAKGFILVSAMMPIGPKRERLLALAALAVALERRQTLVQLIRVIRQRATYPTAAFTFSLVLACLLSDAKT